MVVFAAASTFFDNHRLKKDNAELINAGKFIPWNCRDFVGSDGMGAALRVAVARMADGFGGGRGRRRRLPLMRGSRRSRIGRGRLGRERR